jgi:hypothetical protein
MKGHKVGALKKQFGLTPMKRKKGGGQPEAVTVEIFDNRIKTPFINDIRER